MIAWDRIFSAQDYGALLALMENAVIAAAVVGLMGGLIGVVVMVRDMPFAVHGISELSFSGASIALLLGTNIVLGSVAGAIAAAITIGLLGARSRERNAITGVLMPFGLGLGLIALALYEGRTANKFGLLTGQIVAISDAQLTLLVSISAAVVAGLLTVWRPLMFVSIDPEVAVARGVAPRLMSFLFMCLLGLAVAVAIHIVGALLVLSLLVTPAAAALRVTSSPVGAPLMSMLFALVAALGGVLLAIGSTLPVSAFVTTISFVIYICCRVVSSTRGRIEARTE